MEKSQKAEDSKSRPSSKKGDTEEMEREVLKRMLRTPPKPHKPTKREQGDTK